MTTVLRSYVEGKWVEGSGDFATLVNPTTEEPMARTSTRGLDFARALAYARDVGGPALRALGFAARAELLGKMSKVIHEHREALLDLAVQNGGNTRGDGKFDLDGATATLSYYAKLGASLGDGRLLADGPVEQIGRSPRLVGRHVLAPRQGAAVLINAFNFPAWGFAEKAACALLAGMPVVTKPATSTALVAARVTELLVEAEVMPPGALTFVCGGAGDLLDHLDWQDVVAFTGSADTALAIRGHRRILERGVRVNVEADSINAAVLGPDVSAGDDLYELFLAEVSRDVTQKAGQKCTAIRRILVPQDALASARDDLRAQIAAIKVGDPGLKEVKVGPLATAAQLRDVQAEVAALREEADVVLGGGERGALTGVQGERGFFMAPTLLEARDPDRAERVHGREAFGPVATLMAYDGTAAAAVRLLGRGRGSLVSSLYTDDNDLGREVVEHSAAFLGRIHLAGTKVAEHSPGPGTVLPMMVHGGPGRAGGGEELGGLRGLHFYMQRTAVQGYAPLLDKLAEPAS